MDFSINTIKLGTAAAPKTVTKDGVLPYLRIPDYNGRDLIPVVVPHTAKVGLRTITEAAMFNSLVYLMQSSSTMPTHTPDHSKYVAVVGAMNAINADYETTDVGYVPVGSIGTLVQKLYKCTGEPTALVLFTKLDGVEQITYKLYKPHVAVDDSKLQYLCLYRTSEDDMCTNYYPVVSREYILNAEIIEDRSTIDETADNRIKFKKEDAVIKSDLRALEQVINTCFAIVNVVVRMQELGKKMGSDNAHLNALTTANKEAITYINAVNAKATTADGKKQFIWDYSSIAGHLLKLVKLQSSFIALPLKSIYMGRYKDFLSQYISPGVISKLENTLDQNDLAEPEQQRVESRIRGIDQFNSALNKEFLPVFKQTMTQLKLQLDKTTKDLELYDAGAFSENARKWIALYDECMKLADATENLPKLYELHSKSEDARKSVLQSQFAKKRDPEQEALVLKPVFTTTVSIVPMNLDTDKHVYSTGLKPGYHYRTTEGSATGTRHTYGSSVAASYKSTVSSVAASYKSTASSYYSTISLTSEVLRKHTHAHSLKPGLDLEADLDNSDDDLSPDDSISVAHLAISARA